MKIGEGKIRTDEENGVIDRCLVEEQWLVKRLLEGNEGKRKIKKKKEQKETDQGRKRILLE